MKSSIERVNGRYVRYWHKADNLDPPINARFRGKTNNFQTSKIFPIKIHGACSRLNLFWRCFERRRNPDRLRNRQRLRFKLIAYQDKRAKENGSSDQEVKQQRHSHRPFSQQRPIGLPPNLDRGRRWICAADHTRDEIRDRSAWSKQRCPLLAQSGHRLAHCTCPLLTQSRHGSGLSPCRFEPLRREMSAIGP